MASAEERERLIARLAAAPAHFQELLARLEDADSVTNAPDGEWSPHEIVAHLRATNDILEPRILQVLVRPNTPLIGFDETLWVHVLGYAGVPVTDLLQTMAWRRKEIVHALREISPEAWERTGTHEVRGPLTVFELAVQVADHEDEHLAQIAASIEGI